MVAIGRSVLDGRQLEEFSLPFNGLDWPGRCDGSIGKMGH